MPRKHFNPKHPSSLWTTASRANMLWLLDHVEEMIREKSRRYPDKPVHFCAEFVQWVRAHINESIVPDGNLTPFAIAINEDKLCRQVKGFENMDRTDQYRLYIKMDKPFAKWKLGAPDWFLES
jgi:hypothetical protein